MHFQFCDVTETIEHSANILSSSIMRSVSSRWNFQHTAYLSAVFILLEDALAAVGHRVYFRSLYSTQRHAIRISLLLFFSCRRSSVEPSRLSAWIFHRECALPREGINLFCATTVALFCKTRLARRPCKKVPLGVYSTSHVAANGRCYTGRDTVTGELRVEK